MTAVGIPGYTGEPVEPTRANLEALRADLHHLVNPVVGSLRWYAQHETSVSPQVLAGDAARLMQATDRMDAFLGDRPQRDLLAELQKSTAATVDSVEHEADHLTAPLLACAPLNERTEPQYRCTIVAHGAPVAARDNDGRWTLFGDLADPACSWTDVVAHTHGEPVYVVPDPAQIAGREFV